MVGKLLSYEELCQLPQGTKVLHSNAVSDEGVREVVLNYHGYAKVLLHVEGSFMPIEEYDGGYDEQCYDDNECVTYELIDEEAPLNSKGDN